VTDYTKSVNFTAKDALPTGDSGKIVRGAEIDTEFNNIATSVNSKADKDSPTFTGTITAGNLTVSSTLNAAGTLQVGGVAVTSTAAELNILDGVTATATELNTLDGITASTAELNILDGVTATTAELNILDGVTATTAELNILDGVTATTAELNFVDGVTSNVQTQLNAKAPTASPTFTGTVTAANLNASGSVGVGTVTPDGTVNIFSSTAGAVTAAGNANELVIEAALDPGMSFLSENTGVARINFGNPDDNDIGGIVYEHAAEALRLKAGAQTILSLSTDIGFGTQGSLHAGNFLSIGNTNSVAGQFRREGTDGAVVNFEKSTTLVGNISVTATSTAYNTSSDYRLKENIVPLAGAADRVNALRPLRFNFTTAPDVVVDGFLAHEAQAVVPEAVTGAKDALDERGDPIYQSIDQSKLVPLLVAALQEALARIEALEAL
jgi:hypothetical protein